jgi:hypothetical protein
MFGVPVAEDPNTANEVVLKALRARLYGWQLDGWVDPIVVLSRYIPVFVELRDSKRLASILEMDQCRQQEQEWNR